MKAIPIKSTIELTTQEISDQLEIKGYSQKDVDIFIEALIESQRIKQNSYPSQNF